MNAEDTLHLAIAGLMIYANESTERLLIAARLVEERTEFNQVSVIKQRVRNERMDNWKGKAMHGQLLRQLG